MTSMINPFTAGVVEGVSRVLGELYTGGELTRIAKEVPLRDDPGEGNTKWRRLALALERNQAKTGTGNALVRLVTVTMRPDRTLDRKLRADVARDELNQILSLAALTVSDSGQVVRASLAKTDTEALQRTQRLHKLLVQRGAHEQVLAYCRVDLPRSDFYEAVFEAIKGLGSRLRGLTGLDLDGSPLIERAMLGSDPRLSINSGATRTERAEQLGVANLAKGLFGAFRNPAAHEPKIHWTMSEQDALEVLGTLSLIHRRLDSAR